MKHCEIEGYLAFDNQAKVPVEDNAAYVRHYQGDDDREAKDSNSLFEVEMNSNVDRGDYVEWQHWRNDSDSDSD
jgi:hypothetical protein